MHVANFLDFAMSQKSEPLLKGGFMEEKGTAIVDGNGFVVFVWTHT